MKLIVQTINSPLQKYGINIGSFLKYKTQNNNKFSQNYYFLQNSDCISGDRTGYGRWPKASQAYVSVT
jgi:hypothetical protein